MNKLFLEYKVSPCLRSEITDFMDRLHYLHDTNGLTAEYCFKMEDREGKMIGAAMFGPPAMVGQFQRFGVGAIELRRLVCVDDTRRNAESFFIGRMLRWLQRYTEIRTVVSYADPEYGHEGIVYKASNFMLQGKTASGKVIFFEGKKYHDKAIRSKYNGKLKPFAEKIRKALESGEATYEKTAPKNIYAYFLK